MRTANPACVLGEEFPQHRRQGPAIEQEVMMAPEESIRLLPDADEIVAHNRGAMQFQGLFAVGPQQCLKLPYLLGP